MEKLFIYMGPERKQDLLLHKFVCKCCQLTVHMISKSEPAVCLNLNCITNIDTNNN